METNGHHPSTRQRVALIELTPAAVQRLRDPRIVLAVVAAVSGAGALLAGYIGVSGTLDPGKQLPYLISGGIGGLFLLGLAAALLFSSDVGAMREEIRALSDRMDSLAGTLERLDAVLEDQVSPQGPEAGGPGVGPATAPRPARRARTATP